MPRFSKTSLARLRTCHPDLVRVCARAILVADFAILCGFRDKESQERLVRLGRSRLPWPRSRHNHTRDGAPLSLAVDLAPWPIDWKNTERFARLAGVMQATAHALGVDLAWGGDWKSFRDMPHFELPGPEQEQGPAKN